MNQTNKSYFLNQPNSGLLCPDLFFDEINNFLCVHSACLDKLQCEKGAFLNDI